MPDNADSLQFLLDPEDNERLSNDTPNGLPGIQRRIRVLENNLHFLSECTEFHSIIAKDALPVKNGERESPLIFPQLTG